MYTVVVDGDSSPLLRDGSSLLGQLGAQCLSCLPPISPSNRQCRYAVLLILTTWWTDIGLQAKSALLWQPRKYRDIGPTVQRRQVCVGGQGKLPVGEGGHVRTLMHVRTLKHIRTLIHVRTPLCCPQRAEFGFKIVFYNSVFLQILM